MVGESRPVTRSFSTAAGVTLNPPLGPTRRVGRKTNPAPIAILHEPTLATDIGPITLDETVFDNDPAPNARHFFGPDFGLAGQPLLTDEQPLADSEDSDSDPEPVNQAVDPDIVVDIAEEKARYERPPVFNGDQDPKEWLESY